MATVKVSSEQLAELGAKLNQGAAQVDEQLTTMRSWVAPLVNGEWEGAASIAFQQSWEEWARSGVNLKEALDSISATLVQAARVYQEAEDSVRNSVTGR